MRDSMSLRTIVAVAVAFGLWCAGTSAAQVQPPVVKPVFHGVLQLVPATGRMNRNAGTGTLVIRGWSFIPNPDSNGVFPDREPVLIALGNDSFLMRAGT